MKIKRKLLCGLLALTLVFPLVISPIADAATKPNVKSVVLTTPTTKTLVLNKGNTYKLKTKVTVSPNSAANRKVTFKSSKPSVVSVTSKGVLKAKKASGTAKITVTSTKNTKRKATLTVRCGKKVTKVTLPKTLTINVGENSDVVATIKPTNPTIKKLTWTSSNKSVATVNSYGNVKALKKGTTNITATATDGSGKKATCKVTVQEVNYAWKTDVRMKDLYQNHFSLGMALTRKYLDGTSQAAQILDYHFATLTMGNEMKPDSLLNWQGSEQNVEAGKAEQFVINFDSIGKDLAYAQDHGLKVRFHTLVWHMQTPDWFFRVDFDMNKDLVTKEVMLKRMESYITQIIDYAETNYPGVIYSWDVVNEATEDSAGTYEEVNGISYRTQQNGKPSYWYKIIGPEFIKKAFEYARTALDKYPTTATLVYNDYNCYQTRKTNSIVNLVKDINSEKKLLDAVGMQSHISDRYPTLTNYENAIKKFIEAGVGVHVTELDLGIEGNTAFTDEKLAEALLNQKELYVKLMSMYKKYPQITSVTIWGLNDGDGNWRANDMPLLFDNDFNPKPAFWGMLGQ